MIMPNLPGCEADHSHTVLRFKMHGAFPSLTNFCEKDNEYERKRISRLTEWLLSYTENDPWNPRFNFSVTAF